MESRRNFITKGLLTLGASSLASHTLFAEERRTQPQHKIILKQNDIILFQGDSITDAGRNWDQQQHANQTNALGNGYAMLAASTLLNKFADKNIQIYNRGISGNRVPDLQKRWALDTIILQPTVLSILIGVNDFWRTMDQGAKNSAAQYKSQYQQLLDETLRQLPNVQLIVGEPFAVKNVKHVTDAWYPEFPTYQQAAREIAQEYKALFIPYQQIFDHAEQQANGGYWTTDGIHTSLAGANLMAQAWLDSVQ